MSRRERKKSVHGILKMIWCLLLYLGSSNLVPGYASNGARHRSFFLLAIKNIILTFTTNYRVGERLSKHALVYAN